MGSEKPAYKLTGKDFIPLNIKGYSRRNGQPFSFKGGFSIDYQKLGREFVWDVYQCAWFVAAFGVAATGIEKLIN